MGKSKKKESGAKKSQPACACDHPYKCVCGNRPERPSKGHKWDPETQQWGGKGHKQKGASGQTSSASQAATTTTVGKTKVAQWQRLPSQLLGEFCKKDRRRPPKLKDVGSRGKHKHRCIVPDAKDPNKDLFFVPSEPVQNEEQSKEEACLLALLALTPSLPHERKLPEPYKTTWLHAIEAVKKNNSANKKGPKAKKTASPDASATNQPPKHGGNSMAKPSSGGGGGGRGGGAKASTSLTSSSSYTSAADRRRQMDAKRRERNARVRKHEAIRMANQRHPVFLSASLRQTIEQILRGDTNINLNDDDDDDEYDEDGEAKDNENDDRSDVQTYVEERLHTEGFTRKHVAKAFKQLPSSVHQCDDEEWDKIYEECLQWLLVHLDEAQLPEGLDPRGRGLDVLVSANPSSSANGGGQSTAGENGKDDSESVLSKDVIHFAKQFGLSPSEAISLCGKTKNADKESELWQTLKDMSDYKAVQTTAPEADKPTEQWQEELEALSAIYGEDFKIMESKGLSTVVLPLEDDLTICISIRTKAYPNCFPERILVRCANKQSWPSNQGIALHIDMLNDAATLSTGDPMIFELHGMAQSSLFKLTDGSLTPLSLPGTAREQPSSGQQKQQPHKPSGKDNPSAKATKQQSGRQSKRPNKRYLRPRDRAPFWSLSPQKTPPATAFPSIPGSMKRIRQSLPATKARQEFLDTLKKSEKTGRVVLVQGETGCGKSTQLPQIILEEFPASAKIVVAQPRRLAATGVGARVAEERGETQPGKASVGYVVRGDTAMCKHTRLVFCTTGVLLRQFQNDGALDAITHVVVDEVHERHLDTDVLLGLLKVALHKYSHLKVILMSATLDADRFAAYWGPKTPKMFIPGRTFPVKSYFLEDVLSLTGYMPPKKRKGKRRYNTQRPRRSSPWDDSEMSDEESVDEGDNADADEDADGEYSNDPANTTPKHYFNMEEMAKRVDEANVDYDMLGSLVSTLLRTKATMGGSILVFLSGAPEINQAIEALRYHTKGQKVVLLPLHGGLQPRDQNVVFRPPPSGCTKVICSTNVAETSVTIPDCTVVIDAAREKQSSYDPSNRMPLLLEQFACKASLKQRQGRAGRVREGVCYKLISKATYSSLDAHGTPEIRRCALDQTLLSLLHLGVESGAGTFMNTLLDPPSHQSLAAATHSLEAIGAVRRADGDGNGLDLTPLGVHLAVIPAPPTVGKLLVMGSILGCRTAALAMAAGMSSGRSPFLRIDRPRNRHGADLSMEDMKKERVLDERKELFKTVGNSDHALLAAVFTLWKNTGMGGGHRKKLCDQYGLSFTGMRDMNQMVKQLDGSLSSAGYVDSRESDAHQESWRIIRCCAVSAMSPSQLVKVRRPATKYQETQGGAQEKGGEARTLKFFIRNNATTPSADNSSNRNGPGRFDNEERVFIHPSSFNFETGNYSCPWLVYNALVRTSKPFLRDATECSAYSLLLFGGQLDVQASKDVVSIAGWAELGANARIGALIGGLRKKVDGLLEQKVNDPKMDLASSTVMRLITKLVRTDGLGS